jgi:poly(A) polymerase
MMSHDQALLPEPSWLARGPLGRLLPVLDCEGEEARVVGGAVRNALLGHAPVEIDVATTAEPPEIIRRAEAAGFKAVPTGIEHGTITVVIEGAPIEVTSLRKDVETYGRKARVQFGRDWKADAERRDFTMNALSASRDGMVHDYVGGMADLKARRVRFIGDPAVRIAEDYLRILRFFRFHAAYGHGEPDAAAVQACVAARDGLETLSRERVRMELLKILTAAGAGLVLTVMSESGLLGAVLGGVALLAAFVRMAAIEQALGLPPDPIRRLGALAVSIVEDAERLGGRLRLANIEHDRLASMAQAWWRISPQLDETDARALLYRLGTGRFTDRVLLAWARSGAAQTDAPWRELAALPQRWTPPAFPLRASDLIGRGVAKGPKLGRALAAAEQCWIAAGFPTDRAAIAAIADFVAREEA